LIDEGEAALSMRRIAKAAGVSTMPLYTLFDSKEGLLRALVAEGFRRLAVALSAARGSNPTSRLLELARLYREFSQQNPTYYALIWAGGRTPGRTGRGEPRADAEQAHRALQSAVTDVLVALDRPAREIEPAVFNTWAAIHGFCSLEMAGTFTQAAQADAAFDETLDFVRRGLGA
jgi:AcrR family transcriptional regulator